MRVVLLLGEDLPPSLPSVDPNTTVTLRSIPGDAEEGQEQRETPHSHLRTSLINHRDRLRQGQEGSIGDGAR